jgi:hypothetical protein
MGKWTFKTTPKAEAVLARTISEIVRLFSITKEEAIARINDTYQGIDELNEGYRYWDDPRALACYVCHGDYWWLSTLPLQLKPYPGPSCLETQVDLAFETDPPVDGFFRQVALEMIRRFDIGVDEAVARINQRWRHHRRLLSSDMRFTSIAHELPEYWACDLYFGEDSCWWLTPRPSSKPETPGKGT